MEMVPPKLIEDGEAAKRPTKPLSKRNAVFGAVFMAALVCGIIAVEVILNDTVRAEEDVEKYLELTEHFLTALGEKAKTMKAGDMP